MPLIGIMTDHPYPLPRSFARVCRIAARLQTPIIYFLPGSIDWKSERVFSMKWEGETWKRDWTPLPALVVNQIRYPHIENSHLCLNDKAQFNNRSIPMWSPSFFHKYQLGKSLAAVQSNLSKPNWIAVPANLAHDCKEDELQKQFEQHQILLGKPAFSHSGRGIVECRLQNQLFSVSGLTMGGRHIQMENLSLQEVRTQLQNLYGRNEWFWQEKITFNNHSARPAEWHALLGQDKEAGWQITGIYPLRRSGPGLKKQEAVMTTWSPPVSDSALLATAKSLEIEFGPLPEVTLDFAIDHAERAMLLDASPRVQRHLYPEKIRQSITARWVQFIAAYRDNNESIPSKSALN